MLIAKYLLFEKRYISAVAVSRDSIFDKIKHMSLMIFVLEALLAVQKVISFHTVVTLII